jgi:hypothetical protein
LDADDLWHREKTEKQMRFLNQHNDCEICVTHIENFWSDEVPVDKRPDMGRPYCVPGFNFSALLASRSGFMRVGFLKEDLKHSDDTEWFLRARDMKVAVGMLPEILVRRRLHLSNRSTIKSVESGDEYLDLVHKKIHQMKGRTQNRP